jgi:hypothetical protein
MDYQLLIPDEIFDQAEALHLICTLYHEGQWSTKYRLLSKSPFKPGPLWKEDDVIRDNWHYNQMVEWTDEDLDILSNEIENYLNEQKD